MDWKQILSLSNEDLNDERKEEIYTELIKDQKFDGKIAKKLFPLCLTVLKHKGHQVEKQREEIEMLVSSDIDLKATLEQMEKQKKAIAKFEGERIQYKTRIKELTDEMAMMQGRELQGSDEDSPDQLSDIDRQQELMSNISMKNKHIKRLLRDIEKLEEQSSSHLHIIRELKINVEDASEKITTLSTQLAESATSTIYLEDKIVKLNNQLQEQEAENFQLVQERKDREKEMEIFSEQLEERISMYKNILDEKQRELDVANGKYVDLVDQLPGIDIDSEQSDIRKLMESLKERDKLIKTFEEKISLLSSELMDATSVIKKITKEKEDYMKRLSRERNDKCCEEIQSMLERSKIRCQELQEMLELAEEDNILKAKQAFKAIETLRSYENSEDGLADALKEIHQLQEHVHQRDKQIHELVVELNAQNEVVAENAILRRRCGIPEDEIIETRAFLAKQKKLGKVNDRLMLKLRASEEMRLQLKIDKNDLKRKIAQLETQVGDRSTISGSVASLDEPKRQTRKTSSPVEIKQCESCLDTYNMFDSVKFCKSCIMKQNSNLCDNCVSKFKVSTNENIELIKKIAKLEIDHQSVTEENENLRMGLNEILEKLRDYEGSSERTIINPATLEKLLYILNLRNSKVATEATGADEISVIPTAPLLTRYSSSDTEAEVLKLKMLVKELNEKNDEIEMELDKMRILEKNYGELVKSSELCDDDKQQLLMRSLQRCHEFETNLMFYERKIEFLKNENDRFHDELKSLKLSSLEMISDLKMKVLEKSKEISAIELQNENGSLDDPEVNELRLELQQIRAQLNGFCLDVLKNIKSIDDDNILKVDMDQLSNVTVLENNLSSSFIACNELQSLKSQLAKQQETIKAHEIKEKHLEELTKITQSQLKSQQLMLSQFSDDEITARHLIVDLQSQSNENYLLAKTTRELNISREHEDEMKLEIDQLMNDLELIKDKLNEKQVEVDEKQLALKEHESNNLLKIQYLKKSLVDLCNQFSSMTPVYLIADFVKDYATLLEMKKNFEIESIKFRSRATPELSPDFIIAQLKDSTVHKSDIEAKIEMIKHKSSCDYLKQQLEIQEVTIKDLHNEVSRAKLNEIKNHQHWNAIRMLFNGNGNEAHKDTPEHKVMVDKEVQVEVAKKDCAMNTDEVPVTTPELTAQEPPVTKQITRQMSQEELERQSSDSSSQSFDFDQKSFKSQLKKALMLASSRSALLIETENQLSETQGRIKALEKNLENRDKQKERDQEKQQTIEVAKKDDHILSITIATLQNLLLEKDTTLSRYQELLKSERQHNTRANDELTDEIKQLKRTIDGQETTIHDRNKTLEKLKSEIYELEKKLREALKVQSRPPTPEAPTSSRHVTFNEQDIEMRQNEVKLKEAQNELKKMEQQLRDLQNIERQLQNVIREKDSTIKDLNMKLKTTNDNLDTLSVNFASTTEIDQLRELLEEKDRNIQDLTDTLNQFHDDQQKYINDSAINSAEQVHLISADLNRSDATNRVLKTQLEAVKRQVSSIQLREKQAREMVKTLKNQLIRRPVISVKNDQRPSSDPQMQKRIHDLESELSEVKDELRRQVNINDNKKAKNAAELGLWDKQKRYQELSEKLKTKLTEKEIDYERMKASLHIAKNSITRLERERNMLENKLKSGRYLHNVNVAQQTNCVHCHPQKYSVADTPTVTSDAGSEINHEIISALKSRIESQQRRIIGLELDGKGSNATATEIERLQEHLSSVESQNIRLEARNIQLQLDFDLMKQNDTGDRQEARIKHLEDYILVLKDELAISHAKIGMPIEKVRHDHHHATHHEMEQTILKLKRIIEKLQVENKYLKDSKKGSSSVLSTAMYMSKSDSKKEELFDKIKSENEKLHKSHNEMLGKISALEIELQLSQAQAITVSCPHCNNNLSEMATQDADVLSQHLQQKTALLEKAKSLLTRANAKEKHLREQIFYLKKRVCDLEGVPVISEENSESG